MKGVELALSLTSQRCMQTPYGCDDCPPCLKTPVRMLMRQSSYGFARSILPLHGSNEPQINEPSSIGSDPSRAVLYSTSETCFFATGLQHSYRANQTARSTPADTEDKIKPIIWQ
jgi:hypothetical protein